MAARMGLGFVNPEVKKAQQQAALYGSTAIPPAGGMQPMGAQQTAGTATPPPAAVQQLPMPNMPVPGARPSPQDVQPLPQAEMPMTGPGTGQGRQVLGGPPDAPQGGLPMWAKVAGALGHIILSADAGYHGRPMPESPVTDMNKQQDQDMQVTEFLFNSVARGWEVSRKAPPGQREAMLEQFADAVAKVAPEFDFLGMIDSLKDDADRVDELAPILATMSPEAKEMFMSGLRAHGGDAQAAADLLKDEKFMRTLTDFEDRRNATALKVKSAQWKQAMKKLGMPDDSFADTSPDDFAIFNQQMPKGAQLSPSELQSIKRHPELAAMFGLATPQTQRNQTLDSRAGNQTEADSNPDAGPSTPPEAVTPQAAAPARPTSPGAPRRQDQPKAAPVAKPPAKPSTKPIMPSGEGAVYNRPGYRPELADPAVQRSLKKEAGKRGVPEDAVSQRLAEGPPKKAAGALQTFTIPKGGKTIPGLGKMKEGERVSYDPSTGKYRRG